MSENTLRLGYIGLGNIGGPMAARLAAAAPMTAFDVSPDALAAVVDAGATAADSLAGLATSCDLISICVRDDDQVREVVGGLLDHLAPGSLIAVHSTISPETAAEQAELCARHDVVLLDAPISGGAPGAKEGRLAIMIGGDRAAYDRAKAALAPAGDMIVHAGPNAGDGTRMKLARNLLHFISFTATTEAARLAEAAGIDIAKLGRVVRHTDAITGGAGAIMLRDTTAPIAPDDFWYGVFTHVRELGEKDLTLALGLADELGVDLPLGRRALTDLAAGLGVPHLSPVELETPEGEQR
ncbi:NAD(P)-dependent oxidoreductase [Gordonia neofelifaecis]|uniref:3-hydroxyisobutyrate dehydrogenase n=1 Tax=Gordonia neofelifaecis NRRL B-59395 TaxID=644548 RepID=F1YM50_9ACTN|nr:NAD(P)-dependent oxidoreductase [Gordonia neofelifaecis]EGD54301.1 3-hydroxyisobutyrate dehydrogenase [Gordonia neofelifaecis NRRL B-59395]